MLDEGVPVDSFDGIGFTALQRAAWSNRTDVIHKLLQRGADVNKRDRDYGRTALHYSAMFNKTLHGSAMNNSVMENRTDVIRLLLENGASTTIKDNEGRTPIDLAREWKSQEAVLLLQQ